MAAPRSRPLRSRLTVLVNLTVWPLTYVRGLLIDFTVLAVMLGGARQKQEAPVGEDSFPDGRCRDPLPGASRG